MQAHLTQQVPGSCRTVKDLRWEPWQTKLCCSNAYAVQLCCSGVAVTSATQVYEVGKEPGEAAEAEQAAACMFCWKTYATNALY
jgi:hypothetical protein